MALHLTPTILVALVVGIIASITDIRTTKIFNVLTFPAALIGLILRPVEFAMASPDNIVAAAIAGFIDSMFGLWLGLLLLGIFKGTIMKKFGGGDVKLMAALGALIGPKLVFVTFLYYCFGFGFYTCFIMMLAFPWRQAALAYAAKTTGVLNLERFNQVRKAPLPMAPFIFAGLLGAVLLQELTFKMLGL